MRVAGEGTKARCDQRMVKQHKHAFSPAPRPLLSTITTLSVETQITRRKFSAPPHGRSLWRVGQKTRWGLRGPLTTNVHPSTGGLAERERERASSHRQKERARAREEERTDRTGRPIREESGGRDNRKSGAILWRRLPSPYFRVRGRDLNDLWLILPHAPDRHSCVGGSALLDLEKWCMVPSTVWAEAYSFNEKACVAATKKDLSRSLSVSRSRSCQTCN